VSAPLTALQRSLGIRLIQRNGHGLQLTDAGAINADYLRRVLGLDEASTAASAEDAPAQFLEGLTLRTKVRCRESTLMSRTKREVGRKCGRPQPVPGFGGYLRVNHLVCNGSWRVVAS
jgi:hypothetical protein